MTKWQCYNDNDLITMTQRRNDTMTQWHNDNRIMTWLQWHNDTTTQWHNDTMTQWQREYLYWAPLGIRKGWDARLADSWYPCTALTKIKDANHNSSILWNSGVIYVCLDIVNPPLKFHIFFIDFDLQGEKLWICAERKKSQPLCH